MNKKFFLVIAILTLIVAGVLSPFASSFPDGFERVAEDYNFIHFAKDNFITTALHDYSLEGVGGILSTSFAGIIGVVFTFFVIYMLTKGLAKLNK